tara:strand:+ start:505 stop:2106 length:1602 start_codon:yes stop_codon:yes gene_type:complete
MKNFLKKNQIYFFIVILFSLSSFYLGYVYSYFNTDIHHYSHNLEPFLDFKNGFELNKDIFVLYGNGQIHLFNLINNIFDINIVSIGLVAQFFFSIKFLLFFFILRYFINNLFSTLGTFFYYILYTFTQTASADIFASFFLHLFLITYLYNSKSKNIYLILISSVILFTVIFFRSTYLINFFIFLPFLIFLNIFFRKNLKYENKIFFYFFLILFAYLFTLLKIDNIYQWFNQSIGVGFTNFLNLVPYTNDEILNKIGKLFFYILRIFRHIIYPNSFGSSFTFSIIILSNILFLIIFIYQYFFKKNNFFFEKYKLLIIISLIGICGSIQLINKFETARYINASFGFIVIFFYFVNHFFYTKFNLKKKIALISVVFLVFAPAFLKFPIYSNIFISQLDYYNGNTKFNFNNNYFKTYKHTYFGSKKFNNEHIEFYEQIQKTICTYDYIYNKSFDRSFHYLCKNKKKYIPSLYYKKFTNKINIDALKNFNYDNSVLISDYIIPELLLIKKIKVPKYTRYTKSDKFYIYFTDTIYIYEI